ncbi:MAG: hypothetical protein JST73_03975, partial [Actinobacteria bacterium]|nr:hypothetical protein [Actinomycetota bacterium]
MGTDRDRGRHHLGHDTAGRPHSAPDPTPKSEGGPLQPSEPVASRSTEAEATDLVSLRRAKRGDTGAFADLVRANDDDVRNLVWALVGGPDLDELCTRVYVRAFRGLPLAPSTSPRIWLLGIADGTARDALRRRSSQHASESVAGPPIPVDLASRQRLVLASIDAVGLTARETARLTGGDIAVVRELLRESHDAGLRIEHRSAPPHHTDFWNALGRRLLVEQSGPAASRPVDPSATVAEFSEPVARFPTRATTAAARGMAIRVDQQHPRTVPWRPILVTVAVLLGVGVLVGAALSAARHASRHDAGLGETAEKTLDQLDASLARNVVVSGTVRISSTEPEA